MAIPFQPGVCVKVHGPVISARYSHVQRKPWHQSSFANTAEWNSTDTSQISLTAWITSKCQSARYTILSPLLEALCHGSVDESKDHDRLILKRTQPSKRHAIQNRTKLRLHRLAKIDPRKALPWLPYMKSLGFKADLRNSTLPPTLWQGDLDYLSTSRWYPAQRPELRWKQKTFHIYPYRYYRNIIIYVMIHSRSGNHRSYTKRWGLLPKCPSCKQSLEH